MSPSLLLFFSVPAMLLALATRRPAMRVAGGGDPVAAPARRSAR